MARNKRRGFAIVGMACRFPDADDPDSYWANLLAGRESILPVSDAVLSADGVAPSLLSHSRYRKFSSSLADIDLFDAESFGYSPAEAAAASPQHRLFLETCWEALEDGGYTPEGAEAVGPVGVWAGESPSNYARHVLYTHSERGIDAEYLQHLIGGDRDYLASAVSYRLGLTGPSLAIQTACSTSLVAVLAACDALASGSCAMALAGGATIRLPQRAGYLYQDGGIFSDDGHCRPFDARAGGTVFGSGVGAVLLKRAEDALADGDPIHAVILGGAVNNDGAVKAGFTAPSPEGQQRVIASALKNAGIEAATVGYVEAHGTATPIGDPIEFEALTAAFGLPAGETCALGTAKSNLGHLETAAGIAGLIKAACAVREGRIPPSLHFETPNPEIDFAHSPFFVPVAVTPWPVTDTPRRAGVSSFGVGGTNAHLVVQEPPRPRRRRQAAQPRHIVLSAPSETALRATAGAMARWLRAHPDVSPADVAATLRFGRRRFSHDLGLVAQDAEGLAETLDRIAQGAPIPHAETPDEEESASRRLHLPVTVRDRARHWIDPERAGYRRSVANEVPVEKAPAADSLGLEMLAGDDRAARFGFALARENPWCADHRRDGVPVLAGAAVAVLMQAAAARVGGVAEPTPPVLEDLHWRKMVEPGSDGARLEIAVSGPDRTEIRLTEADGSVAADARIRPSAPRPATLDLDALKARCAENLKSDALYGAFARHGFTYGPAFHRIASVAVGEGECLIRVEPAPDSSGPDAGVLDAAFQAVFPLLPGDGATWVPVGFDRLAVHDGDGAVAWIHVRRNADEGEACRFDMTLCDEAGRAVAGIDGARLRRAADPVLMRAEWRRAPLSPVDLPETGVLFLLGGEADTAAALAPHLPAGFEAVRVEPGIAFECLGDSAYAIDLIEGQDWRQLLDAAAGASDPVFVLDLLDESAAGGTDRGLAAAMLSKVLQAAESPRALRWLTVHCGGPGAAAIASLGRVLAREDPSHRISALHLETDPGESLKSIAAELLAGNAPAVRSGSGGRELRAWVPLARIAPSAALADGLYIVAGGAGALGSILAAHILDRAPGAHVALLGRDLSSGGRSGRIAALGPRAVGVAVDLSDGPAVEGAVADLRAHYGPVRGVVHAAGVMRDELVARFSKDDFAAVVGAKAQGASHLDAATRDDHLDWFVLYSSLVGEVGNPGQAAYGYANGWLDAFAETRAGPGRSVSILWPYWADGGMAADREAVARARTRHGLLPLSQAAGLRAFEAALAAKETRVLVAHGEPIRLAEALEDRQSVRTASPQPAPKAMPDGIEAALIAHLRQVVGEVCGRPLVEVAADTGFESLGIDSLAVLGLTDRLERDFGTLSKTLFYQFATVRDLAAHLIERYGEAVAGWAGTALPSAEPAAVSARSSGTPTVAVATDREARQEVDAIAIIGLAGRYPGAADLDDFWTSLAEGRDLIREVPMDRWGGAFPPPVKPGEKGGSYARWGSFLDDIDQFDPLFFRMSPREAALLDPQERLFLQTVWHLFEDAAIDPTTLRGAACGVFVGVMWGEYQLYGPAMAAGGERPSASYASIANRVSFGFDFAGPSLAVDTMCSSSLTAIHLACEAIRSGDCTMAVAGGVNLAPHPNKWVLLSQGRFASTDGRCRAFGTGGDGYVPGEGVGAVLLKPLVDARRDGDRIWGVIRGSAINHGGRSNAYTVPNPRAQSAVIAKAMARAGVPVESISYVEAHGTGTALGDPIEVAGLATAFGEGLPVGSIALGSIKSNIGHLESAAGIAALTKVLLQMRAGEIAPSLHAEPPNPDIDFTATPFRVATERTPWSAPEGAPRRAGISGFGAGGANAHLIVEAPPPVAVGEDAPGPQVVLLSARTAPALDRLIETYIDWLDAKPDGVRLADIAFTSQIGRQAQDERLAIVAESLDDLAKLLRTAKTGGSDPHIARGGQGAGGALRALLDGADGAAFVDSLVAKRDLAKIAQLWATGYAVDWSALASGAARRIGLPLYSFDRLRCWIDASVEDHAGGVVVSQQPAPSSRPALLVPEWAPSRAADVSPFSGGIVLIGGEAWPGLGEALDAEIVPASEAASLLARLDGISVIVDAGLDDALDARSALWRGLAGKRDGPRLLVLRPAGSSIGALAGGYGAALSGEYGGLLSRELQLPEEDGEAAAAAVRAELGISDGPTRSLWRDGARFLPSFSEASASEEGGIDLSTLGDGPVLITGGLGGLGLALARHFVGRGVTRIALAGLRSLTGGDERSAAVDALRQSGAEVEVHTGSLEDPGFESFVSGLRGRWGPMRLAVHAAGRVGDGPRAFVSRDAGGMRAVAAPKVAGLAALEKALGEDPLLALVLYSSISASVPSLAGGLVDYAAANAALEAHAVEAWSRGEHHVRTIAWGSWTDSGLGAADGDRLAALGLAGLSDAEGVALFERALTVDAPVVVATGLLENAPLEAWPLARMTASGVTAPSQAESAAVPPAASLLSWLSDVFARELRLPAEELDPDRRFEDYGVDSILLADLVVALEGGLGAKLEPGLLLEHRTLAALAAHLERGHGAPAASAPSTPPVQAVPQRSAVAHAVQPATSPDRRIAVIGLACDLPGAADAETFWTNLVGGVDSIREVPEDRWPVDGLYDPEGGPGRSVSKWGGFIEDAALFDPKYFGIPEEDAASLDPLVRKALEVTVQCLRHGGYRDEELKGTKTGVFLGARMGDYGRRAATRRKRALTGSAQNFIAAQVAHCLDLHGANLVVDTACSSSLTAVHLACRSLLDGESDYALAGGVDLLLDETPYLGLSAGQALSPRGRCRTFDAGADGFVPGEGAGVVLLRRLDQAVAAGDRVLGVIEGGAVNNDGRTMGLTTPNPEAQEAVIRAALERAGADPESVSYVEAHGTGTLIGDPIELKALGRALGETGDTGRCGVGSVKTNIGHLLSAAGIASLIKVVLMVERGTLVPTLHCETPNPRFAFGRSALRPVTETEPWTPKGGVRRAGVSSFGFGGTNVHLVVADAGIDRAAIARQVLPPQVFDRQPHWIERGEFGPPTLWGDDTAEPLRRRVLALEEIPAEAAE